MVDEPVATSWSLGSDIPVSDPVEDVYGYAPFAAEIAEAIIKTGDPQGLVLAIHGEWGAGKTSLLNFIRHNLKGAPEHERPILVTFNPWWFEGREQIASQLLGEFSTQLPGKLKVARNAAKQIGKYAKLITATASSAATYSGHPWISIPITWLGRFITLRPKGIPGLKKQTADALRKIGKRFVFLVDDIDRLTPDEARDFFRAIKALADFPEVVYVLFFDRTVVAKALTTSLGMDGEAYLEKIVQLQLHLPAVDKGLLQQRLFNGLNTILESSKPLPFPFDQGRWGQAFVGGLDHYIRKPRDTVQILNAISVTYPPLAGEVNPVDFMALEFLRVFELDTYATIRDGKKLFCGRSTSLDSGSVSEKAYFEKWQGRLPEDSRDAISLLVSRMFPSVARSLARNFLSASSEREWRQELRPCSPDCFDIYFRFSIPTGYVTRAELDHLISQDTSQEMGALLLDASKNVFPDGHSKARDLLDRLRDENALSAEQSAKLVSAVVSNAQLILRPEDERGGILTSLPNSWRILGLTTDLLGRMTLPAKQELLMQLASSSPGIWLLVHLADMAEEATRDPSKASKAIVELESGFPSKFASAIVQRLNSASVEHLMSMPELYFIVHWWSSRTDTAEIRRIFEPAVDNDDKLLALLDKFVTTGWRDSGRGATETYKLAMAPLGVVMDLDANEPRIRALQSRTDLDRRQRSTINGYLRGLQRIHEGKNPDGLYFDDPSD